MVTRHPDFVTISTASTLADMSAARGWLIDCFEIPASEIQCYTDDEIFSAICRLYVGGWSQFVADGCLISV